MKITLLCCSNGLTKCEWWCYFQTKEKKKTWIQPSFSFFWSITAVTPCIWFYCCDSSMNMLFFSMLGYSSVVCIWDRGSKIKWVIFRCLLNLVSFSSYKFYSTLVCVCEYEDTLFWKHFLCGALWNCHSTEFLGLLHYIFF